MASIAFPVRVREGQLSRTNERAALEALVAIMARTPRGSWSGHPLFGFRDFFTDSAVRQNLPEPTIEELNKVLVDLGLGRYVVSSITRDADDPEEGFTLRLED